MSSKLKNLSDYKIPCIPDDALKSIKIGIVISEWNSNITEALAKGCIETLTKHKIKKENIISITVPGSFELPKGAKYLIDKNVIDTVICIGCVIQGETRHFEFICQAVSYGIMKLNLETNIPVIFGVLTTNNIEQARERAGGKYGNKGVEAAITAIKMASLKFLSS